MIEGIACFTMPFMHYGAMFPPSCSPQNMGPERAQLEDDERVAGAVFQVALGIPYFLFWARNKNVSSIFFKGTPAIPPLLGKVVTAQLRDNCLHDPNPCEKHTTL